MISPSLITITDQTSFISESYKMFCTNLSYMNVDVNNQVLLFTSATAEEGKTTSVANAAISFAQDDKKVLIIECDLRKARIHKLFQIPHAPGLSNLLSEKMELKTYIQSCKEVDNLDIITSGSLPPSPTKLLSSKLFEDLIIQCRQLYDVILIDAPPILHVTDAALLSRVVDGIILVVAAGSTKKEAVYQSKKALDKVNANILGVILTKIKLKKGNPYYYYYHGYYHTDGSARKKNKKTKQSKK